MTFIIIIILLIKRTILHKGDPELVFDPLAFDVIPGGEQRISRKEDLIS